LRPLGQRGPRERRRGSCPARIEARRVATGEDGRVRRSGREEEKEEQKRQQQQQEEEEEEEQEDETGEG